MPDDTPPYETIAETAPIGLFTLDEEGVITWSNATYAELLDIPLDDLIGMEFPDLVDAGYYGETVIEEYLEVVSELLSDENDLEQKQYIAETHLGDGRKKIHSVYISLLPLEDGEYRGTIQAFRDITRQRAYEQELEEKTDRLEAFASVVSHDLRNPLNVAEGRLSLAQADCDCDHLEAIQDSLDRMETLIDDLLSLAKMGRAITDTMPVSLSNAVDTAWSHVANEGATLHNETVGRVEADLNRLNQLFENLFRNAIEHGGDEVTVTVGPLDGGFFVEDDGPGIPAELSDQVLEAGYSSKEGGTGFGLSIVKDIVEGHGWELEITESAAGGARFEITDVRVRSR